ncbi:MAG: DUF2288 family protein [Myxococcales bacterium]|nr:DUF2288 family protein [Myxococcales bacterium]MDD9971188.1 DUF2288 family protein [Myxococcales bacterium]
MLDDLRTKLQSELAVVGYRDLRQHAGRGALFLVRGALPLVEAAVSIAQDDQESVKAWLSLQQLLRPSEEELSRWELELDKRFEYVIVQPFVLAREL